MSCFNRHETLCNEFMCGLCVNGICTNEMEEKANMKEFQTGAVRDTGGKGRMDLLPMCALIRVSKHMEDAILPDPETGKPHYPERNWEIGLPMHTMLDSAMRHLVKYMDGWDDEDHLCAAATNLLMAMWTEEKKPEMQDIPTRGHGEAKEEPQDSQAGARTITNAKSQGETKERHSLVYPNIHDTTGED